MLLKATEFVCYNLTTPLLHLRHLSLVFSPFLLLFPPIHPPSDVSMRGTLRHVCILRRVLCVCVWNYSYPTCCNFKRKDLVVHSSLHALTSLPRGLFFSFFGLGFCLFFSCLNGQAYFCRSQRGWQLIYCYLNFPLSSLAAPRWPFFLSLDM